MRNIHFYKKDISSYIDSYLDNDDEFTIMYEKKFRYIQNNDEILTELASELFNNTYLNSIDDEDKFNMEEHYFIQELLKKEV